MVDINPSIWITTLKICDSQEFSQVIPRYCWLGIHYVQLSSPCGTGPTQASSCKHMPWKTTHRATSKCNILICLPQLSWWYPFSSTSQVFLSVAPGYQNLTLLVCKDQSGHSPWTPKHSAHISKERQVPQVLSLCLRLWLDLLVRPFQQHCIFFQGLTSPFFQFFLWSAVES